MCYHERMFHLAYAIRLIYSTIQYNTIQYNTIQYSLLKVATNVHTEIDL